MGLEEVGRTGRSVQGEETTDGEKGGQYFGPSTSRIADT